ncbi:protein kinase domain-containing protein [Pseudodesulfovibrio sediminis]|uniref:Serine/threonine protein kinase n=1 Tax=Pseudodesulfovibrio sediminis TaxID=2810563 RepID=A0ABN6ET52_9BACT|nr:protein kinase [Pseudodesulfovibrio sediminis]BCS88672.1 serine/threonine protein kinase [Pseudodesulfovibrio sediminis]
MHIGRYAIRGLLGRGGMGAVYKAAMPVTGRIVALKVLDPAEIMEDIMGAAVLKEMFFKEATTMASISHVNVAGILDVGRGDDVTPPHFAMEYYCGNLGALMGETYEVEQPSRRLGVEASLHIAREMLAGLDRLHFEGIIHRDVKPFNVMLAEDEGGPGRVKLIDFGLSKLRGEQSQGHKGMVVGSPYYTAPEQEADPEAADARSDVFSVGVTLFRMLTGQLPDERADRQSICAIHADLDCTWDAFFDRALASEPDDRFQDCQSMIDAMDRLEAAWIERKDATCVMLDEPERHARDWVPRAEPIKVGLHAARAAFDLDVLWRPKEYGAGEFRKRGDGTVFDSATGLVWEQDGARYPLTWDRACAYVARFNRHAHGGRTDWRLPTVDELTTLFTGNTEPGEFCLESAFDPRKSRLWSADTKAFTAAWYADAEMGFVWWQDRTCRFFVRAVSGGM